MKKVGWLDTYDNYEKGPLRAPLQIPRSCQRVGKLGQIRSLYPKTTYPNLGSRAPEIATKGGKIALSNTAIQQLTKTRYRINNSYIITLSNAFQAHLSHFLINVVAIYFTIYLCPSNIINIKFLAIQLLLIVYSIRSTCTIFFLSYNLGLVRLYYVIVHISNLTHPNQT